MHRRCRKTSSFAPRLLPHNPAYTCSLLRPDGHHPSGWLAFRHVPKTQTTACAEIYRVWRNVHGSISCLCAATGTKYAAHARRGIHVLPEARRPQLAATERAQKIRLCGACGSSANVTRSILRGSWGATLSLARALQPGHKSTGSEGDLLPWRAGSVSRRQQIHIVALQKWASYAGKETTQGQTTIHLL